MEILFWHIPIHVKDIPRQFHESRHAINANGEESEDLLLLPE